ncbi:PepSY domain-containing protein [Bacillus sp. FJAT-27245]|uniref:PepSY domain-containing protein n=1 Tax=Bacillus sp. FJAT-27245 TaxID=1684144 RepID=UPI0006A7E42E|nr:PepSY domain-containing protein [Bacillus sp. FJAT-27245]
MKVKLFLLGFILFGLSFSVFQLFINNESTELSERSALDIAVNLYGGKVIEAKEKNGNYEMTLENDKGIYYLIVDGKTMKVKKIKLVELKQSLLSIEEAKIKIEAEMKGKVKQIERVAKNGQMLARAIVEKEERQFRVDFDLSGKKAVAISPIPDSNGDGGKYLNEKSPEEIYEKRAKEIALQQAPGIVTNIAKIMTKNGGHYKVTIDRLNEVAHIYVHSGTGKVSSVSSIPKKQKLDEEDDSDDETGDNDDD